MDSLVHRLVVGAGAVGAWALLLAAPVAAAEQQPHPGKSAVTPGVAGTTPAKQPVGGVQSGELPLPDLNLSEIRIVNVTYKDKRADGQSCYVFGLQPVYMNIGAVGTGPFKVVWEKGSTANGPFTNACQACTLLVPDARPNVGQLPEPRVFNNCGGFTYYRIRLDPDNVVLELRDDNNSQVTGF
jgi:hypothetical protein